MRSADTQCRPSRRTEGDSFWKRTLRRLESGIKSSPAFQFFLVKLHPIFNASANSSPLSSEMKIIKAASVWEELLLPDGFLHHISLVVTEKITDARRNVEPTLQRWVLLDVDVDGVLKKGCIVTNTMQLFF
jgi:hypothetical protein